VPELADDLQGSQASKRDGEADEDDGMLQEDVGSLQRLHADPALGGLLLADTKFIEAIIDRGRGPGGGRGFVSHHIRIFDSRLI